MMISVEKLVQQMVGPLEDIHRHMQGKLSAGSDEYGLSCRPFILHRRKWNSLMVDCSRIVREIKGELMRSLESPIAILQSLYSAMKAAESSLDECIVPHTTTTQTCALRGVRDQKVVAKSEQRQEMRILMVGRRTIWAANLAHKLVGNCWDEVEKCWKYCDSAGCVLFVIHVMNDNEPAKVKAFLEQQQQQNGKPVHAIWYMHARQLQLFDVRVPLLYISVDQDERLVVRTLVDPDPPFSYSSKQSFSESELTRLMEMTMALMKRKLPSRCRPSCDSHLDRPFLDYYFHACEVHLREEDVRAWLVRDALKHVLSPEIPHQHPDDLLIISAALKHTLNPKQTLSPHDLHLLYLLQLSRWEYKQDVASALSFFDSELMHEIDRDNSRFLLRRLRHHRHHNLSVDDAKVDAAHFRKCDNSITAKIAETDHSTIKSMTWISHNHRVAVKKGRNIRPSEIAIQASVRHPNLLPLLCWTSKSTEEQSGGNRSTMSSCKLVMELMDCDLDQWIKDPRGSGQRSTIPLHVCVDVMLQIAKGMEYLHSQHIMHRDLKPANILIRRLVSSSDRLPLLRVKIADFGMSKSDVHTGIHTNQVGTAFYRAPEVMEEDGVYGKKADVYSFAMVCYLILTGEEPFEWELKGSTVSRGLLHRKIREEGLRPKFRRLVAPGAALKDMVEQCWHREESRRPEFMQIVRFLRFVMICAMQLPSRRSHSRPDIVATLETKDLFRRQRLDIFLR